MIAYIGLGTNLGDRKTNLDKAIYEINRLAGDVICQSNIYETEPWGFKADSSFLNMAIGIDTILSPQELLAILLKIEAVMGRRRTGTGYSSRPIDLDILFCDDLVINDSKLVVPHPLMSERLFVLKPLNDICSSKIHPVTHLSIRQMLENCNDTNDIKPYGK